MPLLAVRNLTKSFVTRVLFSGISFEVDTGDHIGFVGVNGCGKSTLFRILLGEESYDEGDIYFGSETKIGSMTQSVTDADKSLYEYTLEVFSELMGIEDELELISRELNSDCGEARRERLIDRQHRLTSRYDDLGGTTYRARTRSTLLGLGFTEEELDRSANTFSGGQRNKAQLARLLLSNSNLLLLDEPTNHLDLEGRRAVSRYLSGKKGYILVSHDRAFLDGCVDHVLSINKANIEVQKGNFSSWWENKQRRDEFELAQNEKLKKEVKRLEQTAREKAQWADRAEGRKIGFDPKKTEKSMGRRAYEGAKSKKQMKRAKAIRERREAAVEETAALLKNLDVASGLKLWPLRHRASTLVTLEDVTARYGDVTACCGVSLVVKQGERVALQGINGCGKSTVLKLIYGQPIDFTGTVTKAAGLVISYVSQDTSGLRGSLSEYARQYGIDESLFKTILRKFGFVRDQFEKDISRFSGGQKKKVLLARSLCEKAHLYIWDEPLNFMDVLSRMQIEELLLEYRPTLLFVEHDKQFCDNIATRTVLL